MCVVCRVSCVWLCCACVVCMKVSVPRLGNGVHSRQTFVYAEFAKSKLAPSKARAIKARAIKARAIKARAIKARAIKARAFKARAIKARAFKARAIKSSRGCASCMHSACQWTYGGSLVTSCADLCVCVRPMYACVRRARVFFFDVCVLMCL
jgi:hypothetical protein